MQGFEALHPGGGGVALASVIQQTLRGRRAEEHPGVETIGTGEGGYGDDGGPLGGDEEPLRHVLLGTDQTDVQGLHPQRPVLGVADLQ